MQDQRGFRRPLIFKKDRLSRQTDVDSSPFHLGKRKNGTFQLAFEGATKIDVFGELRGSEAGLVEELESKPPVLR